MKKKSLYLLLILLLTFSFNINVKASELNCEYRIDGYTLVLIKKKDNNIKYYYYKAPEDGFDKNLNLPVNSDKWQIIKSPWSVKRKISKDITKCPKYVNYFYEEVLIFFPSHVVAFSDELTKECGDGFGDKCNITQITSPKRDINSSEQQHYDNFKEKQLEEADSNKDSSKSVVEKNECIYRISSPSNISIKMLIDKKNNAEYYYSKDINAKSSDITLNLLNSTEYKLTSYKDINYNSCPKYVNVNGKNIYFADKKVNNTGSVGMHGNVNVEVSQSDYVISEESKTGANGNYGGYSALLENDDSAEITCDDIVGSGEGSLQEILKNGVLVLRILIPIVVIGLSIADIAVAIFGDEDKMKKAQSKFIKRLIIAVVFFLVPSLLKLILTLANSIWPTISNDFCGIL